MSGYSQNALSMNGVITISDGVLTIENGNITGISDLDCNNLQVNNDAQVDHNLVVDNNIVVHNDLQVDNQATINNLNCNTGNIGELFTNNINNTNLISTSNIVSSSIQNSNTIETESLYVNNNLNVDGLSDLHGNVHCYADLQVDGEIHISQLTLDNLTVLQTSNQFNVNTKTNNNTCLNCKKINATSINTKSLIPSTIYLRKVIFKQQTINSSTEPGEWGQMVIDDNYIYVYTTMNKWKRIELLDF